MFVPESALSEPNISENVISELTCFDETFLNSRRLPFLSAFDGQLDKCFFILLKGNVALNPAAWHFLQ